ncbi:hypothetical protein SteCoe_1437 [Stentor coeruleus]|uniref:Protein kinase domain-containing protein n=1 Tax=Stentor coeruleus TaxID=5963 RepID=A0A1R2D1U1_9CILI|nr:hypothetical protein SteCoe_1437 [Stentor coeruleus]
MKQVLKEKVSRMLPQFKREVYIMYNLNHPHIIKLLNHFEDEKYFYLLMEFADGGNLYHRLHRQRQFIEVEAAQFFREVVLAVEYLHSHSPAIIHRDIKPENILLDSEGRAKLTDFGWSNYESKEDEAPRKTVCGTLEYLPPEMIEEKGHDTNVDIWCLGVLLYEMLVGFTPFKSQTKKNMLTNISKNKPKFPLSFPPLAKELIIKMLAKSSNERIRITDVKEDRWLKELTPIKETVSQNYSQIPLPNYHDSIPLDFKSYEVVGRNIEPQEVEDSCSDDDFELSSDESSTEGSDKLSMVFLEDLACKNNIRVMQSVINNNQNTLIKSKTIINDTDVQGKELISALNILESKVQTKKRELTLLSNNEKELQAHISDLEIQLSAYVAPSLVEDMTNSIHQLKKELSDKVLELNVLQKKKDTNQKEYSDRILTNNSKENDLHKFQEQLLELKNSVTQIKREGSSQSFEISIQADIMQSKKMNSEQFSKVLSEEELEIAKEIKTIVTQIKAFRSVDEDNLTERISHIEEQITQRKQDLVEIKLNFDGRRQNTIQDGKRKKDDILLGNKRSLESMSKEMKSLTVNEKDKVREQLRKAREQEHLYTIHENELQHSKQIFKKLKENKEIMLNKLQNAKMFKIKIKNKIKDNMQILEDEADRLNEMKVKFYCMQEGIDMD